MLNRSEHVKGTPKHFPAPLH